MRTATIAMAALAAWAAGCGDNIHPGIVITTQVAATTLPAGTPVGAKCAIVYDDGANTPVLDDKGNPLDDTASFSISYDAPSVFSTDASGAVIAAIAGPATVTCAAPQLGLVDATPPAITIVPGPATRAVTHLEQGTVEAGQSDGATCDAFDAFGNAVTDATTAFALSPSGAGTTTTASDVTANLVGTYDVTCVIAGAADVAPAEMVVIPALPASIAGSLTPERSLYAVDDQVTLVAASFDSFGNRVDDVTYAYGSTPTLPTPAPARFSLASDGDFSLTAAVTSPTENDVPLSVSLSAVVDSTGPVIQCMRIDAPTTPADAYMIQQAPATVVVPAQISGAFDPQTVTIGGQVAALDPDTGDYEAGVALNFGMNFFDVIATDKNGVQNSTTCFVLAATVYAPESASLGGTLGLHLGPTAIGDPSTSGLNSLDDIFFTVLNSPGLRSLVDGALTADNPIHSGSCGVFACEPNVTYNGGSIRWNTPVTTMSLINGGLAATVDLPNVQLSVNACGTTCCIGGSTITVTADHITAAVNFSLQLSGGKLRTAVVGSPTVTVGNVSLNSSGFCGFLVDLIQSFFTGTVKSAVQNALTSFINNNVGPLLDSITSSLDITTLGASFGVPRLDGTGTVTLGLGVAFSSLDISTSRALLGIGTKFTPGAVAQTRASLGIAERSTTALLDPPGTTASQPVGISAYEGVLNQVLHGLWRGGYFQASIALGGGSAVIDSELPPVATILDGNTADLALGGVSADLTIPGVIDQPIHVVFGGHASASVSLSGNTLVFGGVTLKQLFVSFSVTLSQSQRDALASFLTTALQNTLGSAINNGLPAFPIPSFTLPASVSSFGLPAGAELGITSPVLSTSSQHCVLDGGFGVRQ